MTRHVAGRWGVALLLACALARGNAHGADIDTRVTEAARNQNASGVRSLLAQRADVNAPEADGTTALIWATHWADLETAKLLVAAGANVKAANRYGVTALAEASSIGHPALIELLLKAGADARAALPEGETPLMAASRTGNVDAVRVLLAHGADVNAREQWQGETALMWAVGEGHLPVIKMLLEVGADANAVAAVSALPHRGRRQGRFFTDHDNGGFTPLMFAARRGDIDAARTLLDAGARTAYANPDGVGPLMIAILNAHFDLAAMLLDRGADPNDGSLYQAVDMHNVGIGETLGDLSKPRVFFPDTHTALDIVKLLLAHGADPNQVFDKTLHTGTRDSLTTPNATPFFRAARSGDLVVMRLLLEKGADPSLASDERTPHSEPGRRTTGNTGLTPIMGALGGDRKTFREASERSVVEAVKLCIQAGADVNAVTPAGDTAMHRVAQRGQEAMIQLLADLGARLDVKNKDGLTPLDFAMGKRGPDVDEEFGPPAVPYPKAIALLRKLMGLPAETGARP